jgi:hypothetical protein
MRAVLAVDQRRPPVLGGVGVAAHLVAHAVQAAEDVLQIGMRRIDAGVDDGDGDARAGGRRNAGAELRQQQSRPRNVDLVELDRGLLGARRARSEVTPIPRGRVEVEAIELAARRQSVEDDAAVRAGIAFGARARRKIGESDDMRALHRLSAGGVGDGDLQRTGRRGALRGGDRGLHLALGGRRGSCGGLRSALVDPEALPLAMIEHLRHDLHVRFAQAQAQLRFRRHADELRTVVMDRIEHLHLRLAQARRRRPRGQRHGAAGQPERVGRERLMPEAVLRHDDVATML